MKRLIIAAVGVALVVLAACGGGQEEARVSGREGAATPTEIPAPTPVAARPVSDSDFCAFAAAVDAALRSGNTDFFAQHLGPVTETFKCDELQDGGGPPECVGASPGTVVEKTGVWTACLQSEGYFVSVDELRDALDEDFSDAQPGAHDQHGEGSWRLYAVSFPTGASDCCWNPDDPDLLATAIGADGTRRALVLSASRDSGTWVLDLYLDCSHGGLFDYVLQQAPAFQPWGAP